MAVVEMGAFRAEVVESHPAPGAEPRQLVKIAGEIDVATAPSLEAALDLAFAERCTVTVDLAGVTLIASSGIGTLVRARQRLHAVGGDLALINASANIRHVFAICGLDDLFAGP
jgi:anti-sigma B factor antagonist